MRAYALYESCDWNECKVSEEIWMVGIWFSEFFCVYSRVFFIFSIAMADTTEASQTDNHTWADKTQSITTHTSQQQEQALVPDTSHDKIPITEWWPKGDLAKTIRDTWWLGMEELGKTFGGTKKSKGIDAYQIPTWLEKREKKRIKKRSRGDHT